MFAKRTGANVLFVGCLFALFLSGILSVAASAEDFHVETILHDLSHSQPRELMRSVTLFHAGRTYDFIHELGELIVFDPAQNQFILLNTRQRRAAIAHVDEINQKLKTARETLANHIDGLKGNTQPAAQSQIDQILFQFDPRFTEKLTQTAAGPKLDLESKYCRYEVLCATPPTPEHARAYLQYADWICRLNYVLSPGRVLPEQRIRLNERLRESNLIPVEVTFTGEVGGPVHVRAQHRMWWELNDKDRELIRQWDALMAGNTLKKVNLQEYQRSLLLSQASRRR